MHRRNSASDFEPHRARFAAAVLGVVALGGAGFFTYRELAASSNDDRDSRADPDLMALRQPAYVKPGLPGAAPQLATGRKDLYSLATEEGSIRHALHISQLSEASRKLGSFPAKRASETEPRARLPSEDGRTNFSDSKVAGGFALRRDVPKPDEAEDRAALNSGVIPPDKAVFQNTPIVGLESALPLQQNSTPDNAAGTAEAAESAGSAGSARELVDTEGQVSQISSGGVRLASAAPEIDNVEGGASPLGQKTEMLSGPLLGHDASAAGADDRLSVGDVRSLTSPDQVAEPHWLAAQDVLPDQNVASTKQRVEYPSTPLEPRSLRPSGSGAAAEPTRPANHMLRPGVPNIATTSGSLPASSAPRSTERGADNQDTIAYVQHTPMLLVNGQQLGALAVRQFSNGQIGVHLGTLLSLFKWKLPEAEFERLSRARSCDQFVSIERLQNAGFDISYDSKRERLALDLR